jgi:hypothetical protein
MNQVIKYNNEYYTIYYTQFDNIYTPKEEYIVQLMQDALYNCNGNTTCVKNFINDKIQYNIEVSNIEVSKNVSI